MKHAFPILATNASVDYVPYDLLFQMENFTAATVGDPPCKGQTRTSEHPVFWSGAYPIYSPIEVYPIALFSSSFVLTFCSNSFFLMTMYIDTK